MEPVTDTLPPKDAVTSVPVHPLIAQRWSPRALRTDIALTAEDLRPLLEAARWAASSGNTQPSRFLVGLRGDETFDRIRDSLVPGNENWARNAGALIAGLVITENEKGPLDAAEYGLGLAVANLVLEGVHHGIVAHQMRGFEHDKLRAAFDLPATVRTVVVIALGHLDGPEALGERLAARECAPRTRIELSELAFTGEYGTALY
ncbi:nitroreductase [Pseudonocardiaceae bacterium YIM PH 21723]|nr:nitroreductase [Pseudonocardiaceae bacterium YIM PH 21723]